MYKLIIKLVKATKYSTNGLTTAFKTEVSLLQELLLLVIGTYTAFYIEFTHIERIILIGSLVFVIIIELINSSIETTVNRIGLERHHLSGLAKDIGSAAVFVSLIFALFCWVMIFFNY